MKWVFWILVIVVAALWGSYIWVGWSLKSYGPAQQSPHGANLTQVLPGGMMYYRWDGPEDGPVVVMVHGFSTPHFIYEQNAEALNAAGFRTLRYDHFGRGWSDRPRVKYDVDFYDATLLGLLDKLGVDEPVGLVGLSMGGPIVSEFAARHPERVSKVFLFVPAGLDTAGADNFSAKLVATPVVGDWIWRMFGKGILLGDPQYDEAALSTENRLQGDVSVQMEYRGYLDALLSTLRHMPMTGREATFEALAATGIPVMAIYGDVDETVLVSSAEKLRGLIPDADVRVVQGGTHGVNYQRHGEVNPMLVEFFLKIRS